MRRASAPPSASRRPGDFTAKLTVTDSHGGRGVADVQILAGNARPEVRFRSPADGRFASADGQIPFEVEITDRGERAVDCTKVKVTYALGHNQHAHPQGSVPVSADCKGVYRPRPESGHDPTASYVYHVLEASYTDAGGDERRSAADRLRGCRSSPVRVRSPAYQDGKGVGLYYGELFVPGSGDWFSFRRINLAGVERMRMEIWQNGTGASVTVHAGAPDGPVVARFDDLEDSGPQKDENGRPDRYETYEARVVDAGGVTTSTL